MKVRMLFVLLLALVASAWLPVPVQADGIIIPEPPVCRRMPCPTWPPPVPRMAQLEIKYHHVTVTIENQVAVTHVDQVFRNPNSWSVEGTYLFPLPAEAAVANFTLWVDGQPVKGEVLSAAEARRKYEEIVRSQRDPALLEYANRGAVQASIFPIPPQGERRIELEYSQALVAEAGLLRYVYPLNTEKFSTAPLESVSVSVDVRSKEPIRAIYSPSHPLATERLDDNHVKVGYEASNVRPDADFVLYYSVGQSEAFHLLTYRDPTDPADPDGFFLLLLAPKVEENEPALAKDVILVLDRSGSMEGEKFRQVQAASRYILSHLNPEDRFNLVSFSTGLTSYADGLRPASEAGAASAWSDKLSAQGSTDINRALLEAAGMVDRERPTYLIFLTDGLPTEGVTQSDQILKNFAASAPGSLRLFAFGVGYDVDTFLLDSLAQQHHGSSTYVQPGQALDEIVSGFYAKISAPVLTDLSLDFGGLAVSDLYPQPLPDLFTGSQIVLVGRYREGGTVDVTLKGRMGDRQSTFSYPEQVFTRDGRGESAALSSLPRLWATRKIGYLLNQIRLNGPDQETVDQVVRLSIRYGIVTPYTSYLVSEPSALGAEAQQRIAGDAFQQLQNQAAAPSSGQKAVEKAAGQGAMQSAEAPAAAPAEAVGQVRSLGARTFVLTGGTWMDTAFDPQKQSTVKVAFLSDEYFALAESDPDLASALALGEQVIVLANGVAYEVVAEGTTTDPIKLPPTLTPIPTQKATAVAQNPVQAPTNTPQAALPTPTAALKPAASPICPAALLPLGLIGLFALRRRRR